MNIRAVDFLRPEGTFPRAGWLVLAVGAACLLGAYLFQEQRLEAQAEQERAEQAQAEQQRTRVQQAAAAAQPSASNRRTQRVVNELNRPWLKAMAAIESATQDPVFLVGASFERSGLVRLDGEAAVFDDVLAYVKRLQRSGALSSVALASHEQVNDMNTGRSVLRFTVVATWSRP